jgi:drug/metabolite transporter (DMT)-like permease
MYAVPLAAVVLVLAAATFHAGWNVALHRVEDRRAAMAVAGLTQAVLLLPFALLDPPWAVVGLAVLSGFLEAAYAWFLAAAYERGALSITYPIGRGTAPFLATLGGWALLQQRPGLTGLAGAVLLGAGLVLLGLAGSRAGTADAVAFAVLVGVTIAAYSVVDSKAVRDASPLAYLAPVFAIEGVLMAASVRFEASRLRRSLRPGLVIAVGGVVAYALVLFAFRLADTGRVATLREVSVLIAIVVAGEEPGPVVWVAAALCVAGSVLAAI